MMKRKFLAVFAAVLMSISLVACGSDFSGRNDSEVEAEKKESKKDKDKKDKDKKDKDSDEDVGEDDNDETESGDIGGADDSEGGAYDNNEGENEAGAEAGSVIIANDAADDFSNAYVGGIVVFGTYEQDGNAENGPEPIEWDVLDINENGMLLASHYVLDRKHYNEELTDVTWETCTLRSWLNNDFLNTAFNSSQQAKINETLLVNRDNAQTGASGGNDTIDKVFLLSVDELLKCYVFNSYTASAHLGCCEQLIIAPVERLSGIGVTMDENQFEIGRYANYGYSTDCIGKVGCGWWLRNPGNGNNRACFVHAGGDMGEAYSITVKAPTTYEGVRPALYIQQ